VQTKLTKGELGEVEVSTNVPAKNAKKGFRGVEGIGSGGGQKKPRAKWREEKRNS